MKSVSKKKSKNWRMLDGVKKHLSVDAGAGLPDPIYLESDFQFVESEENTRREVDLVLDLTRMEPYDDVLDLGCGQGRHTIDDLLAAIVSWAKEVKKTTCYRRAQLSKEKGTLKRVMRACLAGRLAKW